MEISGGNWSDLPIDILNEILKLLPNVEDFIRFGGVCSSWRSASVETKKMDKRSWGPWMVLSEPEPQENFHYEKMVFAKEEVSKNEDKDKDKDKDDVPLPRKFVNLCTKKTIELCLPEAQGRRCFGSTFGWVLTIGLDLNIHLLNPLTHHQISLPHQTTFEYQFHMRGQEPYGKREREYFRRIYIEKLALSSHPKHDEGCVVMVTYSPERKLAIARPGDKAWTDVKCPKAWFDDVIFFDNLFYAVRDNGQLAVCDITLPVPVATFFMHQTFYLKETCKYYLVDISGHLHLVARMYKGHDDIFTVGFAVYKLDFCRKEWIELRDLGDHVLFLGNNASFAITHPDLPSNCIYFTDDHSDYFQMGNYDMGLFDFGEKKIVHTTYTSDCVRSTFCTPLFFIPNLH